MALPSAVRERFNNDPAKFVEFATDEANVEELRKMKLLSPEALERLDAAEAAKAAEKAAAAPGAALGPPRRRLRRRSRRPHSEFALILTVWSDTG